MTAAAGGAGEARALPADRRERILLAAEACFVRSGFDRTTMNDLAREAAMSPANLYRYFDSKEALVVGLVEREVDRGTALVDRLRRDGDARAELLGVVDAYHLQISRETAVLRLGIWSEATRNPAIAELVGRVEDHGRLWMDEVLSRLVSGTGRVTGLGRVALRDTLDALLRGAVAARALSPDYDPAAVGRHLRAVLDAATGHGPAVPPPNETRTEK